VKEGGWHSQRDSYLPTDFVREVFGLEIQEIREIAKKMDIKAGNMIKMELIRAIQKAEKNSECFATRAINDCSHINCLWREDCRVALTP